jgi:hypothetical protein
MSTQALAVAKDVVGCGGVGQADDARDDQHAGRGDGGDDAGIPGHRRIEGEHVHQKAGHRVGRAHRGDRRG